VSGSSPRQLPIAWRDQNNSRTWDPPVDNDGIEVVFVYDRMYDSNGHQWPSQGQGGDPMLCSDVCTVGPQPDIILIRNLKLVHTSFAGRARIVSTDELPQACIFYRLEAGEFTAVRKLMLLR
jgi:hypothetical protein